MFGSTPWADNQCTDKRWALVFTYKLPVFECRKTGMSNGKVMRVIHTQTSGFRKKRTIFDNWQVARFVEVQWNQELC